MSPCTLTSRLARESDLALLTQLRVECGWGAAELPVLFADPNRVYCVFEVTEYDQLSVVGMGCWVLEKAGDPETASKQGGTVHIGALRLTVHAGL